MYLRSMTSQNSQTILKTLFKSRHLFFVFLLFANHAATAAEVPDLGIETVRVNRTTLHPGDTFRLETRHPKSRRQRLLLLQPFLTTCLRTIIPSPQRIRRYRPRPCPG